jgi:hypothetical protein
VIFFLSYFFYGKTFITYICYFNHLKICDLALLSAFYIVDNHHHYPASEFFWLYWDLNTGPMRLQVVTLPLEPCPPSSRDRISCFLPGLIMGQNSPTSTFLVAVITGANCHACVQTFFHLSKLKLYKINNNSYPLASTILPSACMNLTTLSTLCEWNYTLFVL